MNTSKGQRKISDRQILALLRQNYSVSEIAGELGVCADAIRKRMKRMGRKSLPYVMQSESEILQEIIRSNPDIRPSRALQILGLITAIDTIGIRGIKSILGKTAAATLKRMQSDMGTMEHCKSITGALKKISDDLERFDPIRFPNTIGTKKSELLTGE